MLENVSSVTLQHKEGHVVDGTIRNVIYAFIWFSFATVYGRLPHPPLPTMAIATVSLGGTISLCTRVGFEPTTFQSIMNPEP